MNQDQQAAQLTRRQANRVNNREAIMDAARLVFAELGQGATTVRDIIRRTELASGTFYNYFDSKESVFQALTDEIGNDLRGQLSAARAAATTFEAFVENSFFTYFNYYAKDPQTYNLVRTNRGLDAFPAWINSRQSKSGLDEMRHDMVEAMADGVIPNVDVGYLTVSMGGVAFSVLDEMMERDPIDPIEAARFATRLFMSGISGMQKQD
ncbi:TetR/AcrR family transcriptional regulator [Alphaproteobacteria bacterium]|nr:TetR/AcrR family transcriptional regulator [Alphaproteobacteria bacterium]